MPTHRSHDQSRHYELACLNTNAINTFIRNGSSIKAFGMQSAQGFYKRGDSYSKLG